MERNEDSEKGMSLIPKVLLRKTRGAISFGIRGIGVSVAEVEVSRDVSAWVRSRRRGSWLWGVRKNWAGLKRSKRC